MLTGFQPTQPFQPLQQWPGINPRQFDAQQSQQPLQTDASTISLLLLEKPLAVTELFRLQQIIVREPIDVADDFRELQILVKS